mmetsp:Transcript_5089/g.7786  ORF Transcript_5089/g.7786 Transcript_5089/m.7786 type:complete len:90 (-) Transcript_5089:63-332(-)
MSLDCLKQHLARMKSTISSQAEKSDRQEHKVKKKKRKACDESGSYLEAARFVKQKQNEQRLDEIKALSHEGKRRSQKTVRRIRKCNKKL